MAKEPRIIRPGERRRNTRGGKTSLAEIQKERFERVLDWLERYTGTPVAKRTRIAARRGITVVVETLDSSMSEIRIHSPKRIFEVSWRGTAVVLTKRDCLRAGMGTGRRPTIAESTKPIGIFTADSSSPISIRSAMQKALTRALDEAEKDIKN
ncbi:MAG: hypothetical protein PHH08_01900 [Candidatus ainarchaeum sp.]|nr:hypothetical protein [Candidatus ainarchaeum sp.]